MISKCIGCKKVEKIYSKDRCMSCYRKWRYSVNPQIKVTVQKHNLKWKKKVGKKFLREYYKKYRKEDKNG